VRVITHLVNVNCIEQKINLKFQFTRHGFQYKQSKSRRDSLSVDASQSSNSNMAPRPCTQWLAFSLPHNRPKIFSLFFVLIRCASRFELSQTVCGPIRDVFKYFLAFNSSYFIPFSINFVRLCEMLNNGKKSFSARLCPLKIFALVCVRASRGKFEYFYFTY
jgi:hypothetical protein